MNNHLSFLILILFLSFNAWASPTTLNFQARIKKPDGVNLEAPDVSFRFKYMNATGTCTVYIEDFNNQSMVGSAGNVNLALGGGAKVFPPTATILYSTFNNAITNTMACSEGGTYAPTLSTEKRILKVEFIYTGSGGLQTLSGVEINSTPYAWYASDTGMLGGSTAAMYAKFSDFTTCTGGDVLTYNGTAFSCITPGGSFTGNLVGDVSGTQTTTVVDAVGGKTATQISTSVDDTLNATSASTASRIVKRDVLGNASFNKLEAIDYYGRNLVLFEPTDTNYVTVKAPTTFAAGNYVLTLPDSKGLSGQVLSTDGNGVTSWIAQAAGGGVTSVTASAPLLSSGGATPDISMPAATAAVDGYLSATDFTTFNNKVSSQWTNTAADIYFNTGKVGIGINSPAVPLHLVAPNQAAGSNNDGNIYIQTSNAQGMDLGGSLGFGGLDGGGSDRVFATAAGRKENGTSGNYAGYFAIETRPNGGSLAEGLRVTSIGRVGVGLTNPQYKLDVNGDVNIPAGSNFKINGVNLAASGMGGSGTTDKVSKFTASGTIGDSNITDNGTLVSISTDVAVKGMTIGRGTGNNSLSTAVGTGVLALNTTGIRNSVNGHEALISNTTGSWNTAHGTDSMRSNTTGSANTAMGDASLSANTTGDENTSIGDDSLFNNTTGKNNTATGEAALHDNTTGNNNSGFGYHAGYQITTGSNNLVLGSNNGGSIATLDNNIIISDGSGNIRTQFDSTGKMGIGMAPATYMLNVNGDVNIPTGSHFKVNGVNIGTTQWIAAVGGIEYTAGNVGIGTAGTPASKLDVNGVVGATAINEGVVSYVNSGAGYTIPDTTSAVRQITLTANATVTLPAFAAPTGKIFTLTVFIKQDAGATRTIAWAGNGSDTIKWDSGVAPAISTSFGKITILQFTKPAHETVWYASEIWQED